MVEEPQLIPLSQATAAKPLGMGCYRATISDAYVVGQGVFTSFIFFIYDVFMFIASLMLY